MALGRRAMAGPALAALGFAALALAAAVPDAAAVTYQRVADGLTLPVDLVNAGDGSGRLFIAEQGGTVRVMRDGTLLARPFLDLSGVTGAEGERGLLGLAFHPRYRENGRFFVDYTRRSDGATVIASYRVSAADPDVADASSAEVLLTIAQPFPNHNGGALRFGPDGDLYIGMGDGGSGNDPGGRAQDRRELLGKILRIDVDHGTPYAIPAGNPFVDGVGGRAEIFALGVRNPWRFAFDRATGDLYIADVGQNSYEEVDRLPAGTGAGANLGWRVVEGFHCTGLGGPVDCTDPVLTPPIFEYTHAVGCSITGGTVYRGTAVPALAGRYVYADLCSGRISSAAPGTAGSWQSRDVLANGSSITVFGEDEAGELYFADYGAGQIRKLVAEIADRVEAVEYYNASLDHYFFAATPADINALDSGALRGWQRTGEVIPVYAAARNGLAPVCRFYLPPAQGDSHFFSASATECADVARKFPALIEESVAAMYVFLPDPVSGACPPDSRPVYRVWNARADSNHRYTTSVTLRDQGVAAGGVAEGYGPGAVAMCSAI